MSWTGSAKKATQVEFRPNGVVEVLFADGTSSSYIKEDYELYVLEGKILVQHMPDGSFVDNSGDTVENSVHVPLEQSYAQTVTNPAYRGHSKSNLDIWDALVIAGCSLMGAGIAGVVGAVVGAVVGFFIARAW
jgi:hypothetical protein